MWTNRPGRRARQRARASGRSQIVQVAGDYNYFPAQPGSAAPVNTLPPGPGSLVGRSAQLDELLALLRPDGRQPSLVVPTLAGMAGIGKTALALHAAHLAVERGWFPGGALFLDLQGYDPDGQITAQQAVATLARALGRHDGALPPTPAEQLEVLRLRLYRLADQKQPVLIVADNASSAEQVAPLIPSTAHHRILVTSRHTLAALPHARLIDLDQLDSAPAIELITEALLRARPLDPRPTAEPEAIEQLAKLCAGLPLALDIIAQVLAASPGLRVAELGDELADERTRLSAQPGDANGGRLATVRAAFDLSYRRLPPAPARLFRMLGCNPGPEIATDAASALLDQSPRHTAPVLHLLDQAHLIKHQPRSGRWRLHDLIRLYAADLADHDPQEKQRGTTRLLAHYRDTAGAADAHLRALPGQPPTGTFQDQRNAMAWFDAERTNLLSAADLANADGREPIAVSIALDLAYHLTWRRRFDDAVSSARTALDAATRIGDRHGQGAALNNLGLALKETQQYDQAIADLTRATELFRELGDQHDEAKSLNNLANSLREQQIHRYDAAAGLYEQATRIFRKSIFRRRQDPQLAALREALSYDHAIAGHRQAVAIFRALADARNEAAALAGLSLDLLRAGQYSEGVVSGIEATRIFIEIGDDHSATTTDTDLVPELVHAGQFNEAITILHQVLNHYEQRGDRFGYAAASKQLHIIERAARKAQRSTRRWRLPGKLSAPHQNSPHESAT